LREDYALMLEAVSKATFSTLAASRTLKRLASRYGMRRPQSFARRFVAGETLDEAIAAVTAIEAQGLTTTLDHLGESVRDHAAALAAANCYADILRRAAAAGVSRNLSVKLTQVGLDIDRATCIDNLRRVLDAANEADGFVRIETWASSSSPPFVDRQMIWRA
jgi:proline dehydrogenase